jgi:DNA polymerase III sliding clamp (beta) subunit (PCNA family)
MNLKITRDSLLNALNSVSVALSSKCGNPYGLFVLLKTDGNTLTVIADSIQLRAEATATCEVVEQGSALISHGKLAALLQRQGDTVTLSSDDKRLRSRWEGR